MRVERQPIDDAMIERYVALSMREYGGGPTIDRVHLHWKYLENPSGVAIADNAWDGEQVVGRIVYQPRLMWRAGARVRAALVVDLLVDHDRRADGVFMPLIAQLLRLPEFDLAFFAPNDTSAPLYEKLLRLAPRQHLDLYAFPTRPHRVLASKSAAGARAVAPLSGSWRRLTRRRVRRHGAPARFVLSPAHPGDDAVDRLAATVQDGQSIVGDRSAAFHRWRFCERAFPYELRYLSVAGALAGYVAYREAEIEGLRVVLIVDLVSNPAFGARAVSALLWRVIGDADARDADLVVALSAGDAAVTRPLRSRPLVRVPRRFAPQRMPLLAREKGGAASLAITFALTLADFDVF